jgi:hypothetical protein
MGIFGGIRCYSVVPIDRVEEASCAGLQLRWLFYSYRQSEHTLTVHGVRNTAVPPVGLTAASIHSSNAKPRSLGLADFATAIHSQVMRAHRKGDTGGECHSSQDGSSEKK